MNGHTPGEWWTQGDEHAWFVRAGPMEQSVCLLNSARPEVEANARLIAQAPTMYEAIKYALYVSQLEDGTFEDCERAVESLREAVAGIDGDSTQVERGPA